MEPVTVARATAGAEAHLAAARANLALVLGSSEDIRMPHVRVTGEEGWRNVAHAIAELFVRGAKIDWNGWEQGLTRRRVKLPSYAFQRERFWVEGTGKRELTGEATGRKLLGRRLRAAGVRAQFETELSVEGSTSWIREHVVQGRAVLPATGHLELMLEAAAEALGSGAIALEDVVLQAPLVVERPQAVQIVVEAAAAGRNRVRVYSETSPGEWQTVSEGWIKAAEQTNSEAIDLQEIRARLKEKDIARFYAGMALRGLAFGPKFRGLTALWCGSDEALGEVRAVGEEEEGYAFAPWRLDACLQAVGPLLSSADERQPALYLPLSLGEIKIYGTPGESCWSYVRTRRLDSETLSAAINIARPDGSPLAVISDFRFRKRAVRQAQTAIYGVDWIPAALGPAPAILDGHWVVLARGNRIGTELARQIEKHGGVCSVLRPEPGNIVSPLRLPILTARAERVR